MLPTTQQKTFMSPRKPSRPQTCFTNASTAPHSTLLKLKQFTFCLLLFIRTFYWILHFMDVHLYLNRREHSTIL